MNRWSRAGLVIGGYLLAALAAGAAIALYDLRFTDADNQASGGMIAGAEMMLGGAVYFVISLVPTAFALWWLRNHRGLWSLLSIGVLLLAIAGLAAVLFPLFAGRDPFAGQRFMMVGVVSVFQMLGSPLWIAASALFALLAPAPHLKRRFWIAAALEVIVLGCAVIHFTVPRPPL